ncbi:unnamed protein product [Moneuplotes crassus]|uniref:RING-CH-type domain-containing protein n=1 Tax=Euplotes crassus TaxID=5936 RepID=A0AAD1UB37_EUPCR|nr:unnamed protein product [Moneuplotes crassus]
MSQFDQIKLEIFSWTKISHGLFDYQNKDCRCCHIKADIASQVFLRIENAVKTFKTLGKAKQFKEENCRYVGRKQDIETCSFLFCFLYSEGKLNIYSYNQLEVILNYFDDNLSLAEIDLQLGSLFEGCVDVKEAKDLLKFLGAEPFSKDLWKVAKTLDWRKNYRSFKLVSKGVEIFKGNIIKMGRLKMRLMDMKLQGHNAIEKSKERVLSYQIPALSEEDGPIDVRDISIEASELSEEIPPCRFCLSNVMDDKNNPLINPCSCKGTQGLLHLDCLKSWMESSRNHKVFSQHSEMYTWKALQCELCKTPYPFKICFGGKTESLLQFKIPEGEFLAFETFLKEGSDKATSKSVYILNLEETDSMESYKSLRIKYLCKIISLNMELRFWCRENKLLMKLTALKICFKSVELGCWHLMFKKSNPGIFSCCRKEQNIEEPTERRYLDRNPIEGRQIQETHGNLLDSQIFLKLEQDIEDLQKDRDSVFYLDDDFYNKLVGIYNQDQKTNRRSIEVYDPKETVDDLRPQEDSKKEESDSSDSEDDNSNSSGINESDESDSTPFQDSESIGGSSIAGVGVTNMRSQVIQKKGVIFKAIPK